MKRYIGAIGAAIFAMTLAPSIASATSTARVVTDLNVRAGPGTQYPAVTVFPRASRVNVIGCTAGITWCDVSGRGVRGWVSARYLEFSHRGDRLIGPTYGATVGLPIITFQIGSYWDRHYRDRSWYRDRSRWDRRWDRGPSRQEIRRAPSRVERAPPPRTERWDGQRGERWDGRRGERWRERSGGGIVGPMPDPR